MPKRITKLERELALALDIASCININPRPDMKTGAGALWRNPSPFQERINELLVRAGRQAVTPGEPVEYCNPVNGVHAPWCSGDHLSTRGKQ